MGNKKLKVVMAAVLALLVLNVNAVYCAPLVEGFGGDIADGNDITISGSNFGINGPTIFHYNNFESGTNGELINAGDSVTLGESYAVCGPPYDHYYSNRSSVSGSMAMESDLTENWGFNTRFDLPEGVKHIFVSFWIYLPDGTNFPGTPIAQDNWKFISLWDSLTNYGEGKVWAEVSSGGGAQNALWRGGDGWPQQAHYIHESYFTNQTKGVWFRFHIWVDPDGIDHYEIYPEAVYDYYGNPTGPGVVLRKHRDDVHNGRTIRMNMLPDDKTWSYIKFPHYGRSSENTFPMHDDIYFAIGEHARARIEIGNKSDYMACTNLTISTVKDWSDMQITATVRQGSFQPGDNAYLFVIDANGIPSPGYPVTIGSGASPSELPLPPPSSLTIN